MRFPMTSPLWISVRLAVCLVLLVPAPLWAEIRLIGRATIPANAVDRSGLKGKLEGDVPADRLGGFSAIAYTGKDNRYVLLPDRGAADGATAYQCRFHMIDITHDGKKDLKVDLVSTTLLHDGPRKPFLGSLKALGKLKSGPMQRLDPEGIAVGPKNTLYISEEYGPAIHEFDMAGRFLKALKIPDRFLVAKPSADPVAELAANPRGRMPNRGMEGLTLTPDGKKLVGIMQSPLIQDGGRKGLNARLLEVDLATGKTREFVYPLESTECGLNEILAISANEFLVIERDSKVGEKDRIVKIYRINLADATDVSGIDSLPETGLPPGVSAVRKTLFIDLLDPRFGLAGSDFPEKVEGLAFGPDLPDGRRLLLVCSDNDFADQPSHFWAFAIDPSRLSEGR